MPIDMVMKASTFEEEKEEETSDDSSWMTPARLYVRLTRGQKLAKKKRDRLARQASNVIRIKKPISVIDLTSLVLVRKRGRGRPRKIESKRTSDGEEDEETFTTEIKTKKKRKKMPSHDSSVEGRKDLDDPTRPGLGGHSLTSRFTPKTVLLRTVYRGSPFALIHWKDFPREEATWELIRYVFFCSVVMIVRLLGAFAKTWTFGENMG
jgi:hypothetical protein